MASPFVPVPVPLDRASSGGNRKARRTQRASSLGSVSSTLTTSTNGSSPRLSNGVDRGRQSLTPPPLRSPVSQTGVNGTLESFGCPGCPRSVSDPVWSQQGGEQRPITPTVLGYEVMEERAKFTVYKVLVRKTPEESWVVFRRYTDFSRLNDKLKEMFPGFRLSLPPKRWFKDNYNDNFLEDRQLGLQTFLQNLVAHKDIANWQSGSFYVWMSHQAPSTVWRKAGLSARLWKKATTVYRKNLWRSKKRSPHSSGVLWRKSKPFCFWRNTSMVRVWTHGLVLRAKTWSHLLQKVIRTSPTTAARHMRSTWQEPLPVGVDLHPAPLPPSSMSPS
ncbi:sorting nexin-16 isoform X2 [Nerophis lumbriciformis]|uniref:sorting nexin-16 isoform X2 n=1 Tax=Nerophis lumbriciformis TaxID=546530 RepID=UPI002AE07D0F|nr:sorting nexin-16-like isoform X2 [Nerophis lumbriciformis]XP_061820848.1 sorting nexin-16-like isoform X2 [Nerophis lumbriciformis]